LQSSDNTVGQHAGWYGRTYFSRGSLLHPKGQVRPKTFRPFLVSDAAALSPIVAPMDLLLNPQHMTLAFVVNNESPNLGLRLRPETVRLPRSSRLWVADFAPVVLPFRVPARRALYHHLFYPLIDCSAPPWTTSPNPDDSSVLPWRKSRSNPILA
jgi:hypothetical protein